MHPSDFFTADRNGFPLFNGTSKKMQLYDAIQIVVPNDPIRNRKVDANAQLFKQLPLQTLRERFARFPLSSGELPETG